jgi:putative membrane protein
VKPSLFAGNALRGMLIGTAEVIPGVSGGTVALIVGVYDHIINGISHLVRAVGFLLRAQPAEAGKQLREIKFTMLLPILFGMILAILTTASILEPLLVAEPEIVRAAFAGMLVASLYVPIRLVGRGFRPIHVAILILGATTAFWLTSVPNAGLDNPATWQIVLFAGLAVCALVLPGVSGSFFLLAVGMYGPTIAAVNNRDLGYLGLFVLGAIVGLLSFAMVMKWFLDNYRVLTLSLMIGLMIGSLRALWPWQDPDREPLGVSDPTGPVIALFLGAGVVALTIGLERYLRSKATQ